MIKRVLGFLALGAILAAGKASNEDGVCQTYCSAICTMTGDPHVTPFGGKGTFHIPHDLDQATLYEMDGWKVWGPLTTTTIDSSVFQLFYTLNVGDIQVQASDLCEEAGDSTLIGYDWSNGDFAYLNVTCAKSDKYSQLGLFLNMELTKTDTSSDTSATFQSMEEGSSGFCTVPDSLRRRGLRLGRALGDNDIGTCAERCAPSSPCLGKGDPHITTFYGDKYNEQASDPGIWTVYESPSDGGFKITVDTKNDGRTYTFNFGDESVNAEDDCPEGKKTDPIQFVKTFSNGDTLAASVTCTYGDHSKPTKKAGTFFNWEINKLDVTNDPSETFKSIEEKEGSSGMCISKPSS